MRITQLLILLTLLALIPNSAWAAGSTSSSESFESTNSRGFSPEQLAARALQKGIKHRDRALKQEAKAETASSEKKRERAMTRAQKEYAKAIEQQAEALRLDPRNYKAANEMGFALRKTGEFRKAIGAYNYALEINPDFHEATEYRAEAFLALGLYEQVQQSYLKLFRADRALANQLMSVFDKWQADREDELNENETAFLNWVEERKRLAEITRDLSMNNTRSW